jgi:hypothetical protein
MRLPTRPACLCARAAADWLFSRTNAQPASESSRKTMVEPQSGRCSDHDRGNDELHNSSVLLSSRISTQQIGEKFTLRQLALHSEHQFPGSDQAASSYTQNTLKCGVQ